MKFIKTYSNFYPKDNKITTSTMININEIALVFELSHKDLEAIAYTLGEDYDYCKDIKSSIRLKSGEVVYSSETLIDIEDKISYAK